MKVDLLNWDGKLKRLEFGHVGDTVYKGIEMEGLVGVEEMTRPMALALALESKRQS
ncbi:unnamed protein product [Sphenostylis stenocarpa]|uniref:Uncharacterized protein n=1 Tax=Sphenostylis stenocarpa TaxID=92480 RepID=A0AA86VED3_9FABA|nr:unnamed protein product [Sphenostylis stenocarpa]